MISIQSIYGLHMSGIFLRGSTPFQVVIFYLWTDLNEICTAYVEMNSKIFMFMELFLNFGMVFENIFEIFVFFCVFFMNFQKNRSQKLSMLKNQRQFRNLHHRIPHKTIQSDFRFFSFLFIFSVFKNIFI